MYVVLMFLPGMLHGSFLIGKIFLILFNRLVTHKIIDKVHKEETSFIPNGGVAVQGEGHKDYCTEWSLIPAIELPTLQYIYNLLYPHPQWDPILSFLHLFLPKSDRIRGQHPQLVGPPKWEILDLQLI